LLLYTPVSTARLSYVLQWIFAAQLGIPYRVTAHAGEWMSYDGPRLNYSNTPLAAGELRIVPHPLLAEEGIKKQELAVQRWKHSTILFYNQPGAVIPFDLFAAVFYLISRYEEYLPYTADQHGRYPAQQSAAAQYSFSQQPVADEWTLQLGKILEKKFGMAVQPGRFNFKPTYDVDIAWKYGHKGARRWWGGLGKELLQLKWAGAAHRLATAAGRCKDPYDSFGWLDELHARYNLSPLYFFLVSSGSRYDRNVLPGTRAMQSLMHRIAQRYETGLHPSYLSHQDERTLGRELQLMQVNTGKEITRSRQHYIKFTLPETYERLIAAGITDDYSMGYASVNGFRAGTSQPFAWYNLKTEQVTDLRIHPFTFMDATARFYSKQKPDEAWKEWEQLWHAVKKVNGTFISIAHNHLLGKAPENKGWAQWYEKVLSCAQQ
jgi:hypothetical protein